MRAKDNMYIHDKKQKKQFNISMMFVFQITMWISSMPLDGIINREKRKEI
jgi:hypothetical protein